MCKILQSLFDKFGEMGNEYVDNQYVNLIISDLSLRLPRMFEVTDENAELTDKLTNLLLFIVVHTISKNDENTEKTLQKMFDKCSFIGRKIMINLEQNHLKLNSVLKFFICAISAIKSPSIIKSITKQILLLVYRTYTNPKLVQSECKSLSVEIIELLQSKLGEE
jgi:hypothetical protein